MGAVGYLSEPLYAPSDRDGTLLLSPGQEGYAVLGQAWIAFRYKGYAVLKGPRQLVDEGYVNPHDSRMTPNTFEGPTLSGQVGPSSTSQASSPRKSRVTRTISYG